jgi:hypothetical protein
MEMAEGQEKKCSYRFAINGLISVEIVILLQFKRLVTSHAWNYRFTIIFIFYFILAIRGAKPEDVKPKQVMKRHLLFV